MITLYCDDCLNILPAIESNSIDLILTDPPYGITDCKWDSIIDFTLMWKELKRISKPNTPILFFANQPFTTDLINSNRKQFRYILYWLKNQPTGFLNTSYQPLKTIEEIIVFSQKKPVYNPQKIPGKPYTGTGGTFSNIYSNSANFKSRSQNLLGDRHPTNLLQFPKSNFERVHPTQKPVNLLKWLIKSYSDPGASVLDFTMGSGSTGVAANCLNRSFIGIEKDPKYIKIAENRIFNIVPEPETYEEGIQLQLAF